MLLIFLKFIASAALLFAFYRIVLRGKASYTVSRAYLLALPIISVVFSVLTFEVYPSGTEIDFGHYTAPVEADYVPDIAPVQVTNIVTAPAAVQEKQPIAIDWMALLQWGIPAISLLLLLLAVYYICKVLVIKSRMNVETTVEGYSLISSPNVDTPFSFAKTIFLPTSLNEPGKSLIIRHEKAHIRHRHYADVWFMELVTRLLWFNPFVWLCRNELRNVHEFQADHDVISSDVNINAYQTTLLEMVMNVSSPVVNGFNHSFIRRRFVEMKKSTVGTLGRVAKIGTLVWFVAMFCAFTFTEKKSEPNSIKALSPSEKAASQKLLMECKSMVNYSHSLTKNWVYIERASDTPDKLALKKIHNEQFPELQSELLEVSKKWNDSDRKELESIFTFINDTLFAYQKDIMKALNSIADYDDMFNMLEIQIMVQDDEDAVETNATKNVVVRIDALIETLEKKASVKDKTSSNSSSSQDDKYKAMFVYNFTRSVEWPASEMKGDFVICVMNQDDVLKQMKAMANGKMVDNCPISIIGVNNINNIPKSHILYLPSNLTNADISAAVTKIGDAATLIVSDRPGTIKYGSCINLVLIDDKIKFEINDKAIKDRNLQLNKTLIDLAVNN